MMKLFKVLDVLSNVCHLGLQRYRLKWNSFSSSTSWLLVYAVLALLAAPSWLSGRSESTKDG